MVSKNHKLKILFLGIVLVLIMGGTVSGYNYFLASNTLEDEISVTRDPKDLLELDYAPGGKLGDENNEITTGERSEFELKLKNPNGSKSDFWDNIHIRGKFLGVSEENVSISIFEDGNWTNQTTYDLRLVNLNENGTGVDIGPENKWKINPSEQQKIKLRLNIKEHVENMDLQFQAVTTSEKNYEMLPNLNGSKAKSIADPIEDTYIDSKNYGDKNSDLNHLEISQTEEGVRYALLSFKIEDIPDNAKSASLNVHQYWGSNFSNLREKGASIELYSTENYEEGKNSSPEEIVLGKKIRERGISGNGKWYHFDILNYLQNKSSKERINLVLKLEHENLSAENCRIRFYSKEGKHKPSIRFK